jgi:hypothetical protein
MRTSLEVKRGSTHVIKLREEQSRCISRYENEDLSAITRRTGIRQVGTQTEIAQVGLCVFMPHLPMFYKLLTHFGMQYPTEHFRVIISLYKQN